MTLAANHQYRALLAIIAGGAAVVGIVVLTAGSLVSNTPSKNRCYPRYIRHFQHVLEFVEPAVVIVLTI